MERNINPNNLWGSVRRLNGKFVTMWGGGKIHVTKVTDNQVWWDPVSTQAPGTHWAERDVVIVLCGAILSGGCSEPVRVMDMRKCCEQLGIKGYEQVPSYLFAILCAIKVIDHPKAGQVSNE